MLEPVPADRADFLHAILHGIARVEAEGCALHTPSPEPRLPATIRCVPPHPTPPLPRYAALASLGASPLHRVLTSGGGANNPQWMQMRQALLGVPASRAPNTDAAYGAAMLAASVATAE